jgi:hypothetical protein
MYHEMDKVVQDGCASTAPNDLEAADAQQMSCTYTSCSMTGVLLARVINKVLLVVC